MEAGIRAHQGDLVRAIHVWSCRAYAKMRIGCLLCRFSI